LNYQAGELKLKVEENQEIKGERKEKEKKRKYVLTISNESHQQFSKIRTIQLLHDKHNTFNKAKQKDSNKLTK
jgi:intein-encoded DNA endonuclease-like protein